MNKKCGCLPRGMIVRPEDVRDLWIDYCPTHAQAFVLLQALKDVLSYDSEAPVTILAQAKDALIAAREPK